MNAIELRKFFKALGILNKYSSSFKDKVMYVPRLIGICKYLGPILPDVICMIAAGAVGLGGGVLGSIIAIGGSCMVTIIIKIALKSAKPKSKERLDYQSEIQSI
jgi:hypothetical protein